MGLAPAIAIVAIALPAAIIALVAKRWLIPAMVLWFFSPAIVFFGLDVLGRLIGTPQEQPGSIFAAFLLIGSFLLIPWIVICLAGFGLGLVLRLRPRRRPATPAPSAAALLVPEGRSFISAIKAPIEMAGWRERHVGLEGDDLKIDGLTIWQQDWRRTPLPPVQLAHPAHPDQRHRYTIYDVGNEQKPTRFAASELSNGVWGFFVPITLPSEEKGASADGSLRYEHRLGEFVNNRYDSLSASAVLIDVATERVLVDCSAWAFSRISANADGSLFLHLRQNQFDTLFRIDPARRSFRDVAIGGAARPLSELADGVEAARRSSARGAKPPHYRHISPDGTICVDLASEEWSNSHWVNSPKVIELTTKRTLLDLWGTDWDASVKFPHEHKLRLDCRRYHLGGSLSVLIDLERRSYRITLNPQAGGPLAEAPLEGLAQGLEAASHRAAKVTGTDRIRWSVKPHPLAAWRTALLILASALIAIAAVSYAFLYFTPTPVQRLTPLPKMPDFGTKG